MWKRELLRNKLYALLLVGLSLPVLFIDGDATVLVIMLFFAVPMFFAKTNWIMGGSYASQESRRKSVRRHTHRCGEKGDGFRDPAGTGRVRQKTYLWVLHEQFGFGAQRLRTYYDAFHDRIKELVSRYEMEDQDDIWLCTQMLKRIGVDIEGWHKESEANNVGAK